MAPNFTTLIELLSTAPYTLNDLSNHLGLKPPSVLRLLHKLKKLDVAITSSPKGYSIEPLELLTKAKIARYLTDTKYLHKTKIFTSLNSTNTYLLEHPQYSVCLAEHQTAGKGRLGRTWHSPFAQNIYLSLRQNFQTLNQIHGLSLAIGAAVADALRNYGIQEHIYLKWPNDVFWHQAKLAGILVETKASDQHHWQVVIGVGLNVNMPNAELGRPWTDIARITKTTPQRNKLVALLLEQLISTLEIFQTQGLLPFIPKWQTQDLTYHKKITVLTPHKKITGISTGISSQGHLLLKDEHGKIHTFTTGEVSLDMTL